MPLSLLGGAVYLSQVDSRALTTTYGDGGVATVELALSGRIATNSSGVTLTAAQVREQERLLRELAANPAYARALHVDSDEVTVDDGLYEARDVRTSLAPGSQFARWSLTLRRLGGGGAAGANLRRLVVSSVALTPNGFSVTADQWVAAPVGATFLPASSIVSGTRAGIDGTIPVLNTASQQAYVFSGADYNTGECKVWDTTGSVTEADWKRVFSPDHAFASVTHCVIENGLVRFRPHATAVGKHLIDARSPTNTWVAVTDATNGDLLALTTNGELLLEELTPWRVVATWRHLFGTNLVTKTITLERGKATGKVVLSSPVSLGWTIGLRHDTLWRWLLTRNTVAAAVAMDMAYESATAISTLTDPTIILLNNTTNVVGLAAVVNTSATVARISGGRGVQITQTATSLTVYLGGLAYDVSDSWNEAESETLANGAVTGTAIAGFSGASYVRLAALNHEVQFGTLQQLNSSSSGSNVLAAVRVASTVAAASANAGDTLKLAIYNLTAAADAVSVTLAATNATYFATANTWVWCVLELSGWNGTDVIYPYAIRTGAPTAQEFAVDQALLVTIGGGAFKPADVARQALTDVRTWALSQRQVW